LILFMNVFVTPGRITKYNRYNLRNDDRLDVFKYSLASLSVLPFEKVFIFGKLDTPYEGREQELSNYITELFGSEAFYVNWHNEYQPQWQESINFALKDNRDSNVMFLCNDDHIFLDYTTDIVKEVDEKLKNYELASFYFSHWPELLRIAASKNAELDGNFVKFPFNSIDSIQVLTPDLLRSWWFDTNYGNRRMCRSDFWGADVKTPEFTCFVPLREQFRHFDGYTHVGCNESCPPLEIPEGFLDKKMNLWFYGDEQFCNIHETKCSPFFPLKVTGKGMTADYHYTADKIPLFWKKHVKQEFYSFNPDKNYDFNGEYHNREVEKAHARPSNVEIPAEWLEICI